MCIILAQTIHGNIYYGCYTVPYEWNIKFLKYVIIFDVANIVVSFSSPTLIWCYDAHPEVLKLYGFHYPNLFRVEDKDYIGSEQYMSTAPILDI